MSEPEPDLVAVFIPPLVVILHEMESKKGSELTQSEVLDITERAMCIMLQRSRAAKMAEKRGHDDIDPALAWEHWQIARQQLAAR
jgi:hypothetical protein